MRAAGIVLEIGTQARERRVDRGAQREAEDVELERVEGQRAGQRGERRVCRRVGAQRCQRALGGVEFVFGGLRSRIVVEERGDGRRGIGRRQAVGLLVADGQAGEPGLIGPRRAQPRDSPTRECARLVENQVDLTDRRRERDHGVTVTWSMLWTPLTRTNTRTATPGVRPGGSASFRLVSLDAGS